jgi:hypothetical protein
MLDIFHDYIIIGAYHVPIPVVVTEMMMRCENTRNHQVNYDV